MFLLKSVKRSQLGIGIAHAAKVLPTADFNADVEAKNVLWVFLRPVIRQTCSMGLTPFLASSSCLTGFRTFSRSNSGILP